MKEHALVDLRIKRDKVWRYRTDQDSRAFQPPALVRQLRNEKVVIKKKKIIYFCLSAAPYAFPVLIYCSIACCVPLKSQISCPIPLYKIQNCDPGPDDGHDERSMTPNAV